MTEYKPIEISIGDERVTLDPEALKFNEATLSRFLEKEGPIYDYLGRCLANAETILSTLQEDSDVVYHRKFDGFKSDGSSDKRAESQARSDPEVVEARKKVVEASHNVKLLKQHLKSFDRAHDNAISLGHNIRKELDKLSPKIYGERSDWDRVEDHMNQIIGKG